MVRSDFSINNFEIHQISMRSKFVNSYQVRDGEANVSQLEVLIFLSSPKWLFNKEKSERARPSENPSGGKCQNVY